MEEAAKGPVAVSLRDPDPDGMHKGHDLWNSSLKTTRGARVVAAGRPAPPLPAVPRGAGRCPTPRGTTLVPGPTLVPGQTGYGPNTASAATRPVPGHGPGRGQLHPEVEPQPSQT